MYFAKKLDYNSNHLSLLLFHSCQVYNNSIKIMWLSCNFIVCTNIFNWCMLELGSYPEYANWTKVGFYSFKSAPSKYFHFYSIATKLIFVIYFNCGIM